MISPLNHPASRCAIRKKSIGNITRNSERSAFTLIELLVSMVVLTLLVLLTSQLVSNTAKITTDSGKHIDADTEARAVFNRMAVDFNAILKRKDVDYFFQKNAGNDQMAFYSEVPGFFPSGVAGTVAKSNVSLVGFRVLNHQLQRLSKGLVWNGVATGTSGVTASAPSLSPLGFLPNTLAATWPVIAASNTDPDYQVIASQVYRLEFCFLLKDGTLSIQPWLASNTKISGLQDVTAIVVTLAILDDKSRLTAGDLTPAAAKMPDVTASPVLKTPAELWRAKIDAGDVGIDSLQASGQVRVYQRYFPISG